MDYYKRFMGDYQRDTGDLSLAQHGAYTVLLDHYYSVRKPLPAAMEKLHRLCRATTKAEQDAVETVANEFFKLGDDGLRHNGRADEEIAKWEEFAEENRQKGKLGGRPKKNPEGNPSGNPQGNPTGSGEGNPEETQRVSNGLGKEAISKPAENPIQNPNPKPEARSLNHSHVHDARARAPRGDNWPSLGGEEGKGLSEPEPPDTFRLVQATYPSFTGRQDWITAQHYYRLLIDRDGIPWSDLTAAVERYAAFVAAGGVSGARYVLTPAKFFSAADKPWQQPWNLPPSQPAKKSFDERIAALRADDEPHEKSA